MSARLRIGSRGSALALCQAEKVRLLLSQLRPNDSFDIEVIQTTGDRETLPLSEMGGKAVFVRELEIALLQHRIDLAVHSLKDVTASPLEGLALTGFLSPESISDVLVCPSPMTLETLPAGTVLGSGSMRRKALLHLLRPDINCQDIRGNVDTRLRKIKTENLDGILLSEAGLIRLGMLPDSRSGVWSFQWESRTFWACRLEKDRFCPAPGQGVVTIQSRTEDEPLATWIRQISDPRQRVISELELILLQGVGFDCRIPFGAYTNLDEDQVEVHTFHPNGRDIFFSSLTESKLQMYPWARALKHKLI